jgi:seryl-tRNA synthetase
VSKPSLSNYKLLELFMTTISQLMELVHADRKASQDLIANLKAQNAEKDTEIARLKSDDAVEDADYEAKIKTLEDEKAGLETQVSETQAGIDQLASELQSSDAPTGDSGSTDNSGETAPTGESTEPPIETPVEETPVVDSAPSEF